MLISVEFAGGVYGLWAADAGMALPDVFFYFGIGVGVVWRMMNRWLSPVQLWNFLFWRDCRRCGGGNTAAASEGVYVLWIAAAGGIEFSAMVVRGEWPDDNGGGGGFLIPDLSDDGLATASCYSGSLDC